MTQRAVRMHHVRQRTERRDDALIIVVDVARPARRGQVDARGTKRLDQPGPALRLLHVIADIAITGQPVDAEVGVVRTC